MKVEHYNCPGKRSGKVRWRIIDEESGDVLVQGMEFHDSIQESRTNVGEVTEFLEAVLTERSRSALSGIL